jgi:predicted nucleic acid-binding protein
MKFSSDLLRFESLMAIRRKFSESPDAELLAARLATMRQLISEINLLRIDENIYDLLGENVKISHKTLDAIHLATMFYIRQTREAEPILAGVYDKKFRSLCEMHEIKVI